MVREVFIALVPYCFGKVKGLESHFLLITLMRDKYLLHNINDDENMVGSYKNFI